MRVITQTSTFAAQVSGVDRRADIGKPRLPMDRTLLVQPGIDAIRVRLIEGIARATRLSVEDVDVDRPFAELGLSSADATELASELEAWLGRTVSPLVIWDYPTIDTLARHLGDRP